jgi:hypothetical protein
LVKWRATAERALGRAAPRPDFTFRLDNDGLGNQLFRIAGTYAVARRHDVQPRFRDTWPYRNVFAMPPEWFASSWVTARCRSPLPFATLIPEAQRGYLQDVRLWADQVDAIRSHFQPCPAASAAANALEPELTAIPHRTAVHVRRGFLTEPGPHQVLPLSYYEQALSEIREDAPNTVPVVFSDDPSWCREHLPFDDAVYVDGNPNWADLILMAECDRHVAANSTFSWWSAFISGDPRPIVAWITNTLPETFRQIHFPEWREIVVEPSTEEGDSRGTLHP